MADLPNKRALKRHANFIIRHPNTPPWIRSYWLTFIVWMDASGPERDVFLSNLAAFGLRKNEKLIDEAKASDKTETTSVADLLEEAFKRK